MSATRPAEDSPVGSAKATNCSTTSAEMARTRVSQVKSTSATCWANCSGSEVRRLRSTSTSAAALAGGATGAGGTCEVSTAAWCRVANSEYVTTTMSSTRTAADATISRRHFASSFRAIEPHMLQTSVVGLQVVTDVRILIGRLSLCRRDHGTHALVAGVDGAAVADPLQLVGRDLADSGTSRGIGGHSLHLDDLRQPRVRRGARDQLGSAPSGRTQRL